MKKILIADDEPDIIEVLTLRLKSAGYEVLIAYDGRECLSLMKTHKPDLLVLDIKMPNMNGYEVLIALKELRHHEKDFPQIPVIILTASVNQQVEGAIKSEDIKGYLVKPFRATDLLRNIEEVIGPA